jgi:copper chaperone CopZ
MRIEGELEDRGYTARCSYAKGRVDVESDTGVDDDTVRQAVADAGYAVTGPEDAA